MTAESKRCLVCSKPFYRANRVSDDKWRRQVTCSRECAVVYRKTRSKNAMNKHWDIQRARAEAKQHAIRCRADEIAAIEQHLAENGVTVCPPPLPEDDPVKSTDYRAQPMAGWRG